MERAAGIFVVRFFEDGPKVLGLKAFSTFDLPKGRVEEGEDLFHAALRETEEECGIRHLYFDWGYGSVRVSNPKRRKECHLYVARTENDPELRPNPQTGRFEHHTARWLTLDEAESELHQYLRPAVGWLRSKLESGSLSQFISTVSDPGSDS